MQPTLKIKASEFIAFSREKKTLYGSIRVNKKLKYGMFKVRYNPYSDKMEYCYHTMNNRKGKGGFSMRKAFKLFNNNQLSTNPEDGRK